MKFPNKQFTILHVLGDGDFVAVHSNLVLETNTTELSVVHLFRFKDGRIAELWDIGQAIPADSPNTDGLL